MTVVQFKRRRRSAEQERRAQEIKRRMEEDWRATGCAYPLRKGALGGAVIETEEDA